MPDPLRLILRCLEEATKGGDRLAPFLARTYCRRLGRKPPRWTLEWIEVYGFW